MLCCKIYLQITNYKLPFAAHMRRGPLAHSRVYFHIIIHTLLGYYIYYTYILGYKIDYVEAPGHMHMSSAYIFQGLSEITLKSIIFTLQAEHVINESTACLSEGGFPVVVRTYSKHLTVLNWDIVIITIYINLKAQASILVTIIFLTLMIAHRLLTLRCTPTPLSIGHAGYCGLSLQSIACITSVGHCSSNICTRATAATISWLSRRGVTSDTCSA